MSKTDRAPEPFRWDQCSHGKKMKEFCRECRIVWLEDGIKDRERQVKRDRAELEKLRAEKLCGPVDAFTCAICGITSRVDPIAGQYAHDRDAPHDHHPVRR